jgi:hypothetical protein
MIDAYVDWHEACLVGVALTHDSTKPWRYAMTVVDDPEPMDKRQR